MKNSKQKTPQPPTLTGHISFGKVGKGPDGERFIRIIIQVDKQRRKALLRYDDLVDGSRGALAPLNRLGAHLVSSAAKTEFLRRLQDLGPQKTVFKVATRVGPFDEVFVLPDQVISANNKTVETWFDDALADYLSWGRTGGTLEEWKTLEALAEGNSRLILALGTAFVGPLRLIVPIEPFAVQLTGPGATGKTTVGACASSIWGQRILGGKPHPLGAGDAWNNTLNNLERVLATRDHTFLSLNEGHHVAPKDLVAAIFLICEGQGKGRYTEVRRWDWFVPVFSSSNESVAETLQKAGEPLDRAAFDRLLDVPLPQGGFGVYENLHGSATVGDFSRRLKAIYDVNHGVVGRAYVLKILQELAEDREGLASWLEARRGYFIRVARKRVSTDSQHERVISHFATVYAGLRLAGRYGLFKLVRGGARRALLACLRDHLRVTDGATKRIVSAQPAFASENLRSRTSRHICKSRRRPVYPKGMTPQPAPATSTKPRGVSGLASQMQLSNAS